MTHPYSCEHIRAQDARRAADVAKWWHAIHLSNHDAAVRVSEGFCPTCPLPLTVCVEMYPGTDDPWPNMLPFGRCACCLGRYSAENGLVSGWGVPVDDHGHEQPTWRPLHPPIRRTP